MTKKGNVKRFLALALTVLMVVGMLPMSIFAVEATSSETKETAQGTNFVYFNDFNGATDLNGTAVGEGQMEKRVGTYSFTDNVLKLVTYNDNGRYKLSVNTYVQPDGNNLAYPDNSGRSFVYSVDYKLGDFVFATKNFPIFGMRIGDNGTAVMATPVNLNASGQVYVGSKVLATLSNETFTRITYAVNVKENTLDVYVNGELKAEGIQFLTEEKIAQITAAEGYENGFALSYIGLYCEDTNSEHLGTAFYYDNVMLYYGDYVANPVNAQVSSRYIAPTGAEIETTLGENGTLLYYNDFNSITSTVTNLSEAQFDSSAYKVTGKGIEINSGIIQAIDDGNGGKALLRVNKGGNINQSLYVIDKGTYSTHRRPATENEGKSFVYSCDYKLNGSVTAGQLVVFSSWTEMYVNDGTNCWTAIPLWITAEGKVYAASDSWTTSRGGVTGGVTAKRNEMKYDDAMSDGCEYICTLSKTEFVNIAVQVKDNHFKVYLNGEAKTDWKLLMSDSAKELYKEAGDKLYTTGEFALCAVAFNYRGGTTDGTDHFVYDNITVYNSEELVTGSIVKELYDAKTGTGYKYNNAQNAMYYYENGEIVTNAVSVDGALTVDENGKVYNAFDGIAIKSIQEVYEPLSNGDWVAKDACGVDGFTKAFASSNKINGENLYYYKNGMLIKDEAVYDIEIDENTTMGYSVDANGVLTALNGKYNGAYYTNGVKADTFADMLDDLEKGSTYTLTEDITDTTEDGIVINNGVTIDLNGKKLAANKLVATNAVKFVNSGDGEVVIDVPKGEFHYDGVTSTESVFVYKEGTGYVLKTVEKQDKFERNETNNGFSLKLRPYFDGVKDFFGTNGSEGADVEFVIEVTNGEKTASFKISSDYVKRAYAEDMAIQINVTGATAEMGELTVTYIIKSNTGMSYTIKAGTYSVSAAE